MTGPSCFGGFSVRVCPRVDNLKGHGRGLLPPYLMRKAVTAGQPLPGGTPPQPSGPPTG